MPSIQQLFSLEGQTALVTGGTRGIGQAMAVALAEAGADILLVQRDQSNTSTKSLIESLGRKAQIYTADLSSQSSISSLVPTILKDGHRIDILLNCGGIQRRHPSHQFPDSDWNEVLQVNLTTVFSLCRDVGAHMLSREADAGGRRGSIINIASLLSFQGGITVPAYAASKGGVAQLTKALSNEWAGKGINVNAIAPGYIATDMNEALIADKDRAAGIMARIPAGRWGSPDDFKGGVVFLAARASSYISGEILTIDELLCVDVFPHRIRHKVPNAQSSSYHRPDLRTTDIVQHILLNDLNPPSILLQSHQRILDIGTLALNSPNSIPPQNMLYVLLTPSRRLQALEQIRTPKQPNPHTPPLPLRRPDPARRGVDLAIEPVEHARSGRVLRLRSLPQIETDRHITRMRRTTAAVELLDGAPAHPAPVLRLQQPFFPVRVGNGADDAADDFVVGLRARVVGRQLEGAEV
ncbi:hypothetical protein LTR50_006516 [Elasticomyces elasticus]|nr:hypothetical protein LTR50_006516 [Elasticomyces elasticus]